MDRSNAGRGSPSPMTMWAPKRSTTRRRARSAPRARA